MAGKTRSSGSAPVVALGVCLVELTAQTPAAPASVSSSGGTLVEFSNEARFQLDVKVPDAALATYLPTGWTPNIAAQGAAKDCNLRVIFIDRITINGPDGKPVGRGSNRLVYLAAPVREPGGMNVQLIIGGITGDPADAPGPFGNYLLATTQVMRRSTTAGAGPTIDTQDWNFAAAPATHSSCTFGTNGERPTKGALNDVRFYSAKNPAFFQISRQEQVLDILRNVTTNPPDRVQEFSFKGSGGSYAKLFDGTEKALSWDNILWINRTVLVP